MKRKSDSIAEEENEFHRRKEIKFESEEPYKFSIYLNGESPRNIKYVFNENTIMKECVQKIVDHLNKNEPGLIPLNYQLEVKSGDNFSIDTDEVIGKISKIPEIFKIYINFSKKIKLKIFVDDVFYKSATYELLNNENTQSLLSYIKNDLVASKKMTYTSDIDIPKCSFSLIMNNGPTSLFTDKSFQSIKNGQEFEVRIVTKITNFFMNLIGY